MQGVHGWAGAAHSEIHMVFPLSQKIPQAIKSSADLTQQPMTYPSEGVAA